MPPDVRSLMETTPDPGSADPPAPSHSPSAGDSADSTSRTQNPQIGAKPEGLPDKFWDPQTGFRQQEFIADYNKLAEQLTHQTAALAKIPEKPEGYVLPEKLLNDELLKKLPEGTEIRFDEKHPLVEKSRPIFHKHKASPELFQELASIVAAQQLEEEIAFATRLAEEDQKLGEKGPARKKALSDFLIGQIGAKAAQAILGNTFTADQVEALEALQAKFTAGGNVVTLHRQRDDSPPPQPKPPLEERMFPKRVLSNKVG